MLSALWSIISSLLGLGNKAADAAKLAEDVKLGAAAQQATDQGAILDAAKQRSAADAAANSLTDQQLRDSLRSGSK